MKKIFVSLLAIFIVWIGQAQTFKFHNENVEMTIDNRGYVTSLKVCKQELLREQQPLVLTINNDEIVTPFLAHDADGMLAIKMQDGGAVFFNIESTRKGLTIAVVKCSDAYSTLLLCPFVVNLSEEIGELSGYVKGGKVAFGMQALNAKTCAGTPAGQTQSIRRHFHYSGEEATQSAAISVANGTRFQFYCCKRNDTLQHPWQVATHFPYYLPDEDHDAWITGAKLRLWGCTRNDLDTYCSKAPEASSCFIVSLNGQDFDTLLDECAASHAQQLIIDNLFAGSGTYQWNTDLIPSDSVWRSLQAKAADKGIALGAQVSVGKVATNDPLLTPTPSDHILKEELTYPAERLDDKQQAFCVEDGQAFKASTRWSLLQLGDELMTFNSIEEDEDNTYLNGATRGAFGSKAQSHDLTTPIYQLWVEADSTLRADLLGQDAMAISLAQRCNEAGLQCLILKETENLQITGHSTYAVSRFIETLYSHLKKETIVITDQPMHYRPEYK